MDLIAPQRNGGASRSPGIPRVAAAAVLALGIAWPSAVAWKARAELRTLDARVAALRPAAEEYEETLSILEDAQGRIATLREEASASGEPLQILRELTDRLPNGTWLLAFRLEGRKVDIEGSPPRRARSSRRSRATGDSDPWSSGRRSHGRRTISRGSRSAGVRAAAPCAPPRGGSAR